MCLLELSVTISPRIVLAVLSVQGTKALGSKMRASKEISSINYARSNLYKILANFNRAQHKDEVNFECRF